ncbi:MAG: tetratricopeptide repeat protein [Acidobacteriota bacterium]
MLRKAHKPFLAIAAILIIACILWLLQASKTVSRVEQQPAGIPDARKRSGAVPAHSGDARVMPAVDEHEVRALHQALEKKPDHSPILIRLAVLAAAKGQSADAIRYLRAALQHDPGNVEARLELGRALFDSGDVQGAITETRKILDRQPQNPDALYNLGAIYGNVGNREMAEKYWRTLLAASPESESGKRARVSLSQLSGSSPARSF